MTVPKDVHTCFNYLRYMLVTCDIRVASQSIFDRYHECLASSCAVIKNHTQVSRSVITIWICYHPNVIPLSPKHALNIHSMPGWSSQRCTEAAPGPSGAATGHLGQDAQDDGGSTTADAGRVRWQPPTASDGIFTYLDDGKFRSKVWADRWSPQGFFWVICKTLS